MHEIEVGSHGGAHGTGDSDHGLRSAEAVVFVAEEALFLRQDCIGDIFGDGFQVAPTFIAGNPISISTEEPEDREAGDLADQIPEGDVDVAAHGVG